MVWAFFPIDDLWDTVRHGKNSFHVKAVGALPGGAFVSELFCGRQRRFTWRGKSLMMGGRFP